MAARDIDFVVAPSHSRRRRHDRFVRVRDIDV
jgi:hypothetical protein